MTDRREFYSLFKPGNLFLLHQRERTLLASLASEGVTRAQLAELRILEVGCGAGGFLPDLLSYGADPTRLFGLDLDRARVSEAHRRHPSIRFFVGNAANLPVPTGVFDLVIQSTLFTSLLDPVVRHAVAAEMIRVLRPGGFILWFDFRYNNPRNPHVRGVSRREIVRELFPGAESRFRSTLLAPPLARWLVPKSRLAAECLSLVPLLRTHFCAIIRPPLRRD